MTDEIPLYQILTVIDRGSGEVFECRGDQEKVAIDPDNGGIGVEARYDRIGVTHFSCAATFR